eukprot:92465-Prymnesium_polylepis.1
MCIRDRETRNNLVNKFVFSEIIVSDYSENLQKASPCSMLYHVGWHANGRHITMVNGGSEAAGSKDKTTSAKPPKKLKPENPWEPMVGVHPTESKQKTGQRASAARARAQQHRHATQAANDDDERANDRILGGAGGPPRGGKQLSKHKKVGSQPDAVP